MELSAAAAPMQHEKRAQPNPLLQDGHTYKRGNIENWLYV